MKTLLSKIKHAILVVGAFCYSHLALAALPTAKPSSSASQGDYIGLGRETAKDGIELVVQIAGALILAGAAWTIITSFKEVQDKKATWTDFGKTLAGALLVCLLGIILLTQADAVF